MKAIPSKYAGYPWAFTWPSRQADVDLLEHAGMVNGWLREHGLRHNHDYVSFEIDEAPIGIRFSNSTYCIAFKSRDAALMYKMTWA